MLSETLRFDPSADIFEPKDRPRSECGHGDTALGLSRLSVMIDWSPILYVLTSCWRFTKNEHAPSLIFVAKKNIATM
jgi:hypothetical protein